MGFAIGPAMSRRRFLCHCCGGAFLGWSPGRAVSGQVVPVSLEPHHHLRFENEYVRVLDIIVDPGDATLFHERCFMSIGSI